MSMEEENEENYTKAREGEFGISVRRHLAALWVDFGLLILRMLNECSHVDKVNLL